MQLTNGGKHEHGRGSRESNEDTHSERVAAKVHQKEDSLRS